MYIARDRLGDMDPYMTDLENPADNVASRVHTGTMNFAAVLAVPDALGFHEAVGVAHKEARLKRLRALWTEELRGHPGIEILTPDDPTMHAGITSFRLTGRTSAQDNVAVAARLLEEFNIFTVHRTGVAAGACVRVTPALFTSEDDVIALREALVRMTAV
jgi:selenocysteine lyase/cysteine desulfurase